MVVNQKGKIQFIPHAKNDIQGKHRINKLYYYLKENLRNIKVCCRINALPTLLLVYKLRASRTILVHIVRSFVLQRQLFWEIPFDCYFGFAHQVSNCVLVIIIAITDYSFSLCIKYYCISIGVASPGMEVYNVPDQGLADMYLVIFLDSWIG